MRISVAKRDGLVCAEGTVEEVLPVIDMMMDPRTGVSRWTTGGDGRNVAFCWPLWMAEEE